MELDKRMKSDSIFEKFISLTGIDAQKNVLPNNFECMKEVIEIHDKECGKFDDYSLKYVKHIVQACELGTLSTEFISSQMKGACTAQMM